MEIQQELNKPKKDYSISLESIIGKPYTPLTGHFAVHYRGINYIKCPFDYVMYQMILEEVKPNLVVEIGTFNGGGALYISDIISRWGGIVHTIDIESKELDPLVTNNPNIVLFKDGYQGYDISLAKKFNKILVIDDGSHYYHDVKDAFNKFNELVSLNSYYIVEDSVIYFEDPNSHGGGPIKAIEEIIQENTDFEIDRYWCDFFGTNATFNTDGYLKKTKETKNEKKMKPIIIVSSYIYNEETEIILNESLDTLLKTGYDILIVSNSTMKPETLAKVNYHLYISDAIMFGDDYTNLREIDFFFKNENFVLHHFMLSQQKYGLSVLRNLFTSLDLAKSLNYDSFFLVTGDNRFCDQGIEFLKSAPHLCQSLGKKSMIYFEGIDNVNTVPLYSEIDYFKEIIENVKDEEHYKEYLIKTQRNLDFMDVEKFFHTNLKNVNREFILEKDNTRIMEDFPDTVFNLVTGVYNTSKKYNGCLTGLFKRLDVNGEHIGYSIFTRNLNPKWVTRKIEVYHSESEFSEITHHIEPYFWLDSFFTNVIKIRVFENNVLLFEEDTNTKNYIQNEK